MLRVKAAPSISAPDTIAQMAMSQVKATSVIRGQRKAITPAAISTIHSRIRRPQRSPFRAALMPETMANTPSTSLEAENRMTNAPTAIPGVSRQISPKRMPKRPRNPTAHQLSANTSLNASQRPQSDVDALPFAAIGRPPSLAINIGSQSLLAPNLSQIGYGAIV